MWGVVAGDGAKQGGASPFNNSRGISPADVCLACASFPTLQLSVQYPQDEMLGWWAAEQCCCLGFNSTGEVRPGCKVWFGELWLAFPEPWALINVWTAGRVSQMVAGILGSSLCVRGQAILHPLLRKKAILAIKAPLFLEESALHW